MLWHLGRNNFYPFEKKDFECLFPFYNGSAKVIYHKDFIGWSRGDYFEMFVYQLSDIRIDSSYPIVRQDWEYAILHDTTKVTGWINCPIDSTTQSEHDRELTWITDSEVRERKMLEQDMNDANNYYSSIYVSDLQKYFLLYCPSKNILYYIRQKGF